MQSLIVILVVIIMSCNCFAHQGTIQGKVYDNYTQQPLPGAVVKITETNQYTTSDIMGNFSFHGLLSNQYTLELYYVGYKRMIIEKVWVSVKEVTTIEVTMEPKKIQLKEVTIFSGLENDPNYIHSKDLPRTPHKNAQEILRSIPGLFTAQHAGGGKAEQIFIRGFDVDHGTDVAINLDGLPVNMVSHAHGQGYADLHFVIPETIERVEYQKGPYEINEGNFATAGSAGFKTKNSINKNMIKLESGLFDTHQITGMFNLLNRKKSLKYHHAYIAVSGLTSNGFFESPQALRRINVFGKYSGMLNKNNLLRISMSTFISSWNSSGQIPERAVKSGLISRFGSIDDTEGGFTQRTNFNIQLYTYTKKTEEIKNQFYFTHYDFDLHSNFTFFLNDSLNGDQIRQKEKRNLFGYVFKYHKHTNLIGKPLEISLGAGLRYDDINDSELSKTKNRFELIEQLSKGNLDELNSHVSGTAIHHTFTNFEIALGLRLDHFLFNYKDLNLNQEIQKNEIIASPKLTLSYDASSATTLYIKSGIGFHSNDARTLIRHNSSRLVTSAYGVDIGAIIKPIKRVSIHATAWTLHLDNELVYVGDEAIVEPSGQTARYGIDASIEIKWCKWITTNFNINYAYARFTQATEGQQYIPLAPNLTSAGSITFNTQKSFEASISYRYLSDRAANEDNSLIAKGYFLLDGVVSYNIGSFTFNLTALNILNSIWNEAQFETTSRLLNEPNPVTEMHFTPGTPFFIKTGLTFSF